MGCFVVTEFLLTSCRGSLCHSRASYLRWLKSAMLGFQIPIILVVDQVRRTQVHDRAKFCQIGQTVAEIWWYFDFYRATAMLSAVYVVVVSVCACVCVSVTLRYCIKTAKRRITQIVPHDSPVTLVFCVTPKFTAKFERDHHLQGRQMVVGWVNIRHFQRKKRYNSKTVQDRRIVSIKVE